MGTTRPITAVGGILLIAASFLPYGYEDWFSNSLFDFVRDIFSHLSDYDYLEALSLVISDSHGTSGLIIGLLLLSFFLLVIGGVLALLSYRGGSVAGPVAMILLTFVPLYLDGGDGITSVGIAFYVGWAGAILCALVLFIGDGRKKKKSTKNRWRDSNDWYDHTDTGG